MLSRLGLQSDAVVMAQRSRFEDKGEYVIQRTPLEPDYWFGNRIIWRGPIGEPQPILTAFRTAFPKAPHCVISFDRPDFDPPDWFSTLPDFEVDETDVMRLNGPLSGPALPEGLRFRPIRTDADWAAVTSLQTRTGIELGHDPKGHAVYNTRKYRQVRAECEAGQSHWFGVFDGDRLAADMGIVTDGRIARFQQVETAEDFRRQGLCGGLLRQVHQYIVARHPGATFVIEAEAEGAAGRIYARAGFRKVERDISLVKRGY